MIKIKLASLLLCGFSFGSVWADKDEKSSKSVTPEVIDAIATELERAKSGMAIPGAPKPYFIGYKITEVNVRDVSASLGATLDQKKRHFTGLEAHVHVGSHERDNSNFIAPNRGQIDGISATTLPLEASPSRARRAAWLATDNAYKEALEQYQAKSDALATGVGRGTTIASYSSAKSLVVPDEVSVTPLEAITALEELAQDASLEFKKFAHVRDSRVAVTSFIERRWYLNSEGTAATDTRRVSGVVMVASALASDGQELTLYYSKYGHTLSDLPGNKSLANEAKNLASTLKTLQVAPRAGAYTGPVFFEGRAAVQMVAQTLSPHLSGTPPPIGTSGEEALQFAGKLIDRKGMRVVSPLLSIFDDPTIRKIGKIPLIGGYLFDDEGVKSQRVEVAASGKLKDLLMSRTPNSVQNSSNGHARLAMSGGVFRGSATNLMIRAKRGASSSALKRKLISEIRKQDLPYGMLIRLMDDPFITSSRELTRIELVQILNTVNRGAPPPVLLAFKIYPNGKEELVRGVGLDKVDVRAWRDIVAVGKKSTTINFLASTDDQMLQRLAGVGPGFVPSGGIESSVTTPDLLFRELDLVPVVLGALPKPRVMRP